MRSVFATLLLFISVVTYGQLSDELSFSENQFDFGTVKEEAGPIVHEFKFINNSANPVSILNVKASCGCTTPAWTKEPVQPGESGFIQAQYNPRNRPGTFNKSLTITTDYSNQPIRLYIKGNVSPKPKSINEELPTVMGGLRMKYASLNVGKVFTTDEPTIKVFDVYNDTDSSMFFVDRKDGPAHIAIEFEPKMLPAKTKGEVKVVYNAKAKEELGFANDNLTFYTDQAGDEAQKSVSVYATVLEYFPPMTKEELAEAPSLFVEDKAHDFGKIANNSSVEKAFTLVNNGASPLLIRKVDTNCSCTIAKVDKVKVKPGKSTDLRVTFNAESRRGNQQKSITVYTNDPKNPVQRVTIKAYVNE